MICHECEREFKALKSRGWAIETMASSGVRWRFVGIYFVDSGDVPPKFRGLKTPIFSSEVAAKRVVEESNLSHEKHGLRPTPLRVVEVEVEIKRARKRRRKRR